MNQEITSETQKKKQTETNQTETNQTETNQTEKKKKGRPKKQDSHFSINNEKISDIKSDYEQDVLEKKSKRGRPKKADIEAEQTKIKNAESFAKSFSLTAHIGLDIVLKRINENDKLSKDESEAFDDAFTALIVKYFESLNKFGVEVNFIMILGVIIAPRLYEYMENKKLKENKKNDTEKTA